MDDLIFVVAKVGGYLITPLTVVVGLGIAALLCLQFGRRLLAARLACLAFALLWVASTPALGRWMGATLEARYPALTVEQTPSADAILVLGGALAGAAPPQRPYFSLGPAASRVWHAARLHKAGKAKWLVISGGNQPGYESEQAEGDAIAEMLGELGVPVSALRRETTSRTTRENAEHVRAVLQGLGVKSVLLVTSAQHMPRAVMTINQVWAGTQLKTIPASTDVQVTDVELGWKLWLPSLEGLNNVSNALKEFAGIAALDIIGNVTR